MSKKNINGNKVGKATEKSMLNAMSKENISGNKVGKATEKSMLNAMSKKNINGNEVGKAAEKSMRKPFVIAVDGPAAAGKGTLARALAEKLGYRHLDSGKLYRSVAKNAEQIWKLKIPQQKQQIAEKIEKNLRITSKYLEQIKKDKELSEERVALLASLIAPQKIIRKALAKQQIAYIYSSNQGIVLDGRDMGTVICPEAPCKIFLTASPEARAKRRYKEMLDQDCKVSYHDTLRDMCARDARDLSRAQAPLRRAEDALEIDSSEHTIPLVLTQALNYANKRRADMHKTNR